MYHHPAVPKPRLRGFSLVELLTVIAIISILMTVGAIGIGNITAGKGVTTAVANVEALFDEARSTAVSRGTNVRVLINANDPADLESYLRRILIAYQAIDNEGKVSKTWTISNRGMLLADQVYFSQDFSRKTNSGKGETLEKMTLGEEVNATYRGDYFYYEFNGEGICSTPGATFVVGTGARPVGAEKPRLTGAGKRDFGGFVIWRNGRTSQFRSPDQMHLPETISEF